MGNAQRDFSLTEQPHSQILELMAAKALNEKNYLAAFQFADRRCRITPPPLAYCYVLRADAAHNLGNAPAALADLTTALQIAPHDIAANRRQFAWADGDDRRAAAASLISHDNNVSILRGAIQLLHASGQRHWAAVTVYDEHVAGWAAWEGEETAKLTISSEDGSVSSLLEPDPFHPLSSQAVGAVAFWVQRPKSHAPQSVVMTLQGQTFFSQRMASNRKQAPASPNLAAPTLAHDAPHVIVPVYADLEATTNCIKSLLAADPSGQNYRITVINDASPDAKLSRFVDSLRKHPQIEVLTNEVNLGFVGTVNRVLQRLSRCDVVLLNADTVVPPGFVERLAAAARSSTDIGTVMPLSNNGEFSSFPKPNTVNPMNGYNDIVSLDRVAATCNAGQVVDVPSGIGFCLYVTRACLDAISGLSENFQRGYLEDVDLCLRAREHGFRNVCATSVYVGHLGSRSFRTEKRSLVLRNLGVLDRRFPTYRSECAVFETTDPLRASREIIELALSSPKRRPVLLWTGRGATATIADIRSEQLTADDAFVIHLVTTPDGQVRLMAADGTAPQSVTYDVASADGQADFARFLARLRPSHCEFFDLNHVAATIINVLRDQQLPYDIWVSDTRPFQDAALPDSPLQTARRMLAPNESARAFLKGAHPSLDAVMMPLPAPHLSVGNSDAAAATAKALAILPVRSSAQEFLVIRAIATRLLALAIDTPIIVAGSTVADQRLMSLGNVYVTGPADASELEELLRPQHVGWMLAGFDGALFGHRIIEASRNADVPVAYLDWSMGAVKPRQGDLAISPVADIDSLADAVALWIQRDRAE